MGAIQGKLVKVPTPKELKGELEGKFIDVLTNSFAVWHKKRYKVLGYDSETDLYTCAPTKVEGPLEHIKLKAENITVYVDVIPVEESSEDETSKSEDEDDDDDEEEEVPAPFTADELREKGLDELRKLCAKYKLFTPDWKYKQSKTRECREALKKKFGLEGSVLSDTEQKMEQSSNAMAKFLLLPIVVAITSRIPGFNHKNRAHADRFMEEHRKQNGNGPSEYLDPVFINNELWIVRNNCNGRDGLFLQRAKERREEMPSEKRQAARDADNDYQNNIWKPKRRAQGLPTQRPRMSGTKKAGQALKWPFLLMLIDMCKANEHAKAYDHFWAVFTQGGPSTFDPKDPARCGSRNTRVALWVTQLVAAFTQNLALSVIDGEGPSFGLLALYYELGMCFGPARACYDQLYTNILSSRGLPKFCRFDNGKTRKYRTPLADNRADELQKFLDELEAYLKQKGGSILGYWGGGEKHFLDAHLDDAQSFTVMNLLEAIRYMLDLELNGAVPRGHPLFNCRDGVCLSTECIGPVFCGHLKQTPTFMPHYGDYDSVVTREFVVGLCAAAERARLGKADLEWNGKVLDVAAVRAGWTAGEDTGYKQRLARVKRARRE